MLSLGLTLTYMTTRVPNFAHASFALVGAYITWYFVSKSRLDEVISMVTSGQSQLSINQAINTYSIPSTVYAEFVAISFLVVGLIALGQYFVVLKPLRNRGASNTMLMIATIATDMFIFAVVNIAIDHINANFLSLVNYYSTIAGYRLPITTDPRDFTFLSYDMSSVGIYRSVILSPLLLVALLLTFYLVLKKTKIGISMRATIENPPLASVLGINTEFIYALSWFISGGVAGIAGSLIPLKFYTSTSIGQTLIISIFAASILGGLSSLFGSIAGGIVIGISETVLLSYLTMYTGLDPAYRPIIPLLVMVITLLFFPKGITSISLSIRRGRK